MLIADWVQMIGKLFEQSKLRIRQTGRNRACCWINCLYLFFGFFLLSCLSRLQSAIMPFLSMIEALLKSIQGIGLFCYVGRMKNFIWVSLFFDTELNPPPTNINTCRHTYTHTYTRAQNTRWHTKKDMKKHMHIRILTNKCTHAKPTDRHIRIQIQKAHIYKYIHANTQTHANGYMRTHKHKRKHIETHTCKHIHNCTSTNTQMQMLTRTHV